MTTLVAPVVGPLLGGWITDEISWPWIFYINIPIGLGAAAATWALYKERETPVRKLPIDVVGLGLLVLWVGAMQIMSAPRASTRSPTRWWSTRAPCTKAKPRAR